MFVKNLVVFLSVVHCFNRKIPLDPAKVDLVKMSYDDTVASTSFGCKCDTTKGSCDVYCCCDADCEPEILSFWKENYNEYCAKNNIMNLYEPKSKCIANNVLSGFNMRLGMKKNTKEGQTCVSMDVGSVFSNFKSASSDFTENQVVLNPDISKSMLKQKSSNANKVVPTPEVYNIND